MPGYVYTCGDEHCKGSKLIYRKASEKRPKWKKCPVCSGQLFQSFTPPQLSIFQPYVTPDITGYDVEVTSPRQEDALCKQHGVSRLLSTDMTGSRSEIKKNRKKRWEKGIDNLGDFEKQYQEKTRVSVRSGD